MEVIDSKCEFPLDQLPSLVIEKIAWYLSNTDLGACCAVSRGVREAFDNEFIWKPRYDSERAEYLLKTPCKVLPMFESPENTNNDLSPISHSRLAFMAENHLWNNWRQGKFEYDYVPVLPMFDSPENTNNDWSPIPYSRLALMALNHQYWHPPYSHTRNDLFRAIIINAVYSSRNQLLDSVFVTNDCVALILPEKIEICNVKNSPKVCSFKPIPGTNLKESCVEVVNSSIIILYKSSVQVFHLDSSTNEWVLKHSFFIDDTEVLLEDILTQPDLHLFDDRLTYTFTIVDQCIVGAAKGTMHIWNFETGVKIKTESCPVENGSIEQMLATTSKDLIVSVRRGEYSLLLAYSLTQLQFLTFQQEGQGSLIVFSNFVAVWGNNKLNIYDYKNCEVKLEDHPIIGDVPPQPLGSNIVFLNAVDLTLFNPFTSKMQTVLHDKCIYSFDVLFGKFILLELGVERCNVFQMCTLQKIDDCQFFLHPCCGLRFPDDIYRQLILNKFKSRCINGTALMHFW